MKVRSAGTLLAKAGRAATTTRILAAIAACTLQAALCAYEVLR